MSDVMKLDATVARAAARGMITLRGDLSAKAVAKVLKAVTGQAIPKSGQAFVTGHKGLAWMSPDEVLVMVPYRDVAEAIAQIDAALAGSHYLAVDVSDARAVFKVHGTQAAEVLARVCPVDLHADSFAVGQFRRTRMAQVPAAFWRHDLGFDVICFRSVGDYAERLLTNAAQAAPTGALGV